MPFQKRKYCPARPLTAAALTGLLALVTLLPGSLGADEVRCTTISRALAFGSVDERLHSAKRWREDPAALVDTCRSALEEGLRADSRRFADREPDALWRDENRLLLHLLHALAPSTAEEWAPRLDPSLLEAQDVGTLTQYWMDSAEPPIEQAFSLLRQMEDAAARGDVLHALLPRIMELEAESVTAATRIADALETIGARRLVDDRQTAMLWPISATPRPHDAEAALLSGDLQAAFSLYAHAARTERSYLFHTAVLAERLFETHAIEPLPLIPLQISYSLCNRIYRVDQNIGSIYRLRQSPGDPELAAEMAFWRDARCRDPRDNVDRAKALANMLHQHHPGTRAAARQRLIKAEALAKHADQLTESGRSIPAHELRREAVALVEDATFFRFPGGPTLARALWHSLRSALPPELDED